MTANFSIRPRPLPTYRLRMCNPTNKFAAEHIRFGFWAFLPLRIRQSPAVVTPRAIRCSFGFGLSRDFALPATNPSSRAFHSRTCATDHQPARCPSAVFTAERSAFPRFGPRYLSVRCDWDAVPFEVPALLFRHEQRHAELSRENQRTIFKPRILGCWSHPSAPASQSHLTSNESVRPPAWVLRCRGYAGGLL